MIALFLRTCRLELRPNTVLLKWPQNGDGNGSHARKAETRRKPRGVTHATNATPIDATQVMQRLRTDTRRIRNKRRDAKRRQATRRTRDGHEATTKRDDAENTDATPTHGTKRDATAAARATPNSSYLALFPLIDSICLVWASFLAFAAEPKWLSVVGHKRLFVFVSFFSPLLCFGTSF